MNSNASPKNVPEAFGAFEPPAKLWIRIAIAPASFATAILSTNAISPRETSATFPLASSPL